MEFNTAKCGFDEVIIIDQTAPLLVDYECASEIGRPENINITITGIADTGKNSTNTTCRWLDEDGDLVATVNCTPGENIEVSQGNVSRLSFFSP